MNLTSLSKLILKFTQDNSPSLLTAVGVAGTVTTAVLAAQAGFQAGRIIEEETEAEAKAALLANKEFYLPDLQQKFLMTWHLYIPPVLTGAITVSCIIGATLIQNRRAAALAAAYSLSERAAREYKDKVLEKFGETKERQVRQAIAEDRVRENPAPQTLVNEIPESQVLCYDSYTARYFRSDMETLRRAENQINHMIVHNMYASLSDFYSHIGLDRTKISDDVGWNADRMLELRFSTTISDNDRPCLVMDFDVEPIRGYSRIH